MSNVLAIAAVTQLLKNMLNDALINGEVSQVMGADFLVTALPPDRVVNEQPDQQQPTLNLFLHRITPNAALQQEDLPTRDAAGRLTRRPRLALNLHYMLTAIGSDELQAEILLGYAMQMFHETPVLPREAIRAALQLAPPPGADILPDNLGIIQVAALADQAELIKITPHTLSMDDMSKMWTALQARYRTTVAYDVCVVLIERELPTRPTLPVLSRGGLPDPVTGRDPGVSVQPDLNATAPCITAVEPLDGQPVMRLGGQVAIAGAGFTPGEVRVLFTEPGTGAALALAPLAPATDRRLAVQLPAGAPLAAAHPLANTGADPGAWRIGPYHVEVRITTPDGRELQTNALPMALAPATVTGAAVDPGGTLFTIDVEPRIRAGQRIALIVGQDMRLLPVPAAPMSQVQAVFAGVASGGRVPVRLRVDGVDNPIIDRASDPPALITVTVP